MTVTMHIPRLSFGDRLRLVRKEAGLTQSAFADAVGLPAGTVSNYEAGTTAPRHADLEAFCAKVEALFGVPREWLALGRDPRDAASAIGRYPSRFRAAGVLRPLAA